MTSSYTTNVHLEKPANGDDVNTWDVPINADWDVVDTVVGGYTSVNVVAATGTVALTLTQYRPRILVFSGALTANVNYQLPSGIGGTWSAFNNASGAFTITLSSAGGGTTVTLPQGYSVIVFCDGTNVRLATPISTGAAGSNTQVQYNSGGSFAGATGLTTDGTSLTSTGTITAAGFVGPLTGNVTGNVTGNATTATTATNATNATTATYASTVTGTSYAIGYLLVPPNSQGAPYTLALTDIGKTILISNSGSTITIPANASVAFPVGSSIVLFNSSNVYTQTLQITSDSLYLAGNPTPGTRSLAPYALATLLKVNSTSWIVTGAGVS